MFYRVLLGFYWVLRVGIFFYLRRDLSDSRSFRGRGVERRRQCADSSFHRSRADQLFVLFPTLGWWRAVAAAAADPSIARPTRGPGAQTPAQKPPQKNIEEEEEKTTTTTTTIRRKRRRKRLTAARLRSPPAQYGSRRVHSRDSTCFFTSSACLPIFYRVLPSFTGFYRVLPGFTGFYRVLPGFTWFCRILSLYRVLPGYTKFG